MAGFGQNSASGVGTENKIEDANVERFLRNSIWPTGQFKSTVTCTDAGEAAQVDSSYLVRVSERSLQSQRMPRFLEACGNFKYNKYWHNIYRDHHEDTV